MTRAEGSSALCRRCRGRWDASRLACCPACLCERWSAQKDFISPKHHPDRLSEATEGYRSVLTPRFVDEQQRFIAHAARNGRWYFDTHYRQYVHFTPEPLGQVPGVGVPAGQTTPDHALDSLLVADANGEAHVFAVRREVIEAQIRVGEFEELATCERPACGRLRVPERALCAVHTGVAES